MTSRTAVGGRGLRGGAELYVVIPFNAWPYEEGSWGGSWLHSYTLIILQVWQQGHVEHSLVHQRRSLSFGWRQMEGIVACSCGVSDCLETVPLLLTI